MNRRQGGIRHGGAAEFQRAEPDHMARGSTAGQTRLYTLPQAAVALDRAEVTLRRWVRKGLIPYVLINGRYYLTHRHTGLYSRTYPPCDAPM